MRNSEFGIRNKRTSHPRELRLGIGNPIHSAFRIPNSAFTLIELLVVIAIILVLLGAVITVGRSVMERGKEKETLALLQKLDMAAKEWQNKNPLGKMRDCLSRYSTFPPDELDGFRKRNPGTPGIPGSASGQGYIAPTGAELQPSDPKDISRGDIKAFALAVRLFSESGSAILDDVASKYRRAADKDRNGNLEFLDRSKPDQPANGTFDVGMDEPLDYFVDAWGTPIEYYAVRCDRCTPATVGAAQAAAWDQQPNVTKAGDRLKTSLCLLELNNSVPFFVSYGPDGPDQFDKDFGPSGSGEAEDLITDYAESQDGKIDNRFNQDNLYSHEGLKERIAAHAHGP